MTNPLRICMISPHFPPDFGWYGPGRDSLELAQELKEIGHEVTVICCAENAENDIHWQDGLKIVRVNWQRDVRKNSLTAHCMPRSRMILNMNMALWRGYLEECKAQKFDFVEASGAHAAGLLPALVSESPVFLRLFDKHPNFLEKELSYIGNSGFRFEEALQKHLLGLSKLCATSVLEQGRENQLNYSLNTDFFTSEGPSAFDTQGRPTLLVHTSIDNNKDRALLCEVLEKVRKSVPDLFCVIVAHDIFTTASETEMKKMLSLQNIECDAVINRSLSRLIMPALWRGSDCGLVLDWSEMSAQAILEPLSCSVPLIAETSGADLKFLTNQECLANPEDFSSTAIAKKIVSLLINKEEREVLGQKARRYILTNHCRRANTAKILKSFQALKDADETPQKKRIRNFESLLTTCQSLSDSLDQLLYDLLFTHSLRFKVSHWWNKLKSPEEQVEAKSLNSQ